MYGRFLRDVRRSRRLSQAELAAVVGISQPNLSAYERDHRIPTADTLNRLLVACGYQLVAQAGETTIRCPLPRAGWFPDEDDPPRLADDPPDQPSTVDVNTPWDDRAALLTAVLERHPRRMSLVRAVVEVHGLLAHASPSHAFGGALALAQYAEPRATVDIDVNVFVPDADVPGLLTALASIGYSPETDGHDDDPVAGRRLRRAADPYPLDLFLPLGPAYAEIARRIVQRPFVPDGLELPFLSAEDLVLFKLSFGRDRDWVDIRQVLGSGLTLDVDYIERQLIELRGPTMYPRLARLRSLIP